MPLRKLLIGLMVGAGLFAATGGARADDGEPKRSFTRMLNTDALIDNYARFLARKYNLNDEQDAYTQKLMRERTQQFLDKHKDQLFDMVDRMFEVRGGAEMSQDELHSWGEAAQPIYEEAKQMIVQSNDEWRQILNDEQKKIHDEDLRLMNESFAQTEDQLNRINSGDMTIEEFRQGNRKTGSAGPKPKTVNKRNPPGEAGTSPGGGSGAPNAMGNPKPINPKSTGSSPGKTMPGGSPSGRPGEPNGAGPHSPGTEAGHSDTAKKAGATNTKAGTAPKESEWEAYVRDFIQKYQLNEDQAQKARDILKDSQDQAARHLDSKKKEVEKLDKEIAATKESKDKEKTKTLADLNQKRGKLTDPVNQIFDRMKARLNKLPTRAQMRAAEASKKGPTKDAAKGKEDPKSREKVDDKGGVKNREQKPGNTQPKPQQPGDQPQQPGEQQPEEGAPQEGQPAEEQPVEDPGQGG